MRWEIFKVLLSDESKYYFLANNRAYYVFDKKDEIFGKNKQSNKYYYFYLLMLIIGGILLIYVNKYVDKISVVLFLVISIIIFMVEYKISTLIRSNIEKVKEDVFVTIKDSRAFLEKRQYEPNSKIVSPKHYLNFKVFGIVIIFLGVIGIPNLDISLRTLGILLLIISTGITIFSLGESGKQLFFDENHIFAENYAMEYEKRELKIKRIWLIAAILNLVLLIAYIFNIQFVIMLLVAIDITLIILFIKSERET